MTTPFSSQRIDMQTVLSTKKLSESQRNLLLQAGVGLVEYDAIKIDFVSFEISTAIKNAIITSQNTVKALIKENVQIENCFCVGEKTKELLLANGYHVKKKADYGKELAKIITEQFVEQEFTFFCGNLRRNEMPELLKKKNVQFLEVEVYKTTLIPKKFNRTFERVLFFSPSAVKSFLIENQLKNTTAFCIGTTTAAEVKKYTDKLKIATKPTIENVIVQVVNY